MRHTPENPASPNRRDLSLKKGLPPVGVDTVTAVFRVDGCDFSGLADGQVLRATDLQTGKLSERQTGTLGASGLQVGTQALLDGRARVVVSGSLPKVVAGHNLAALPIAEVAPVLRDVVGPELAEVCEGLDVDSVKLTRLDTVTDLECSEDDIGPLLQGLESVPCRRGVRKSLYRSTLERPETLMAMNKGGGMRLYDKRLEAMIRKVPRSIIEKASPGLRVEGQSRVDWLKSMGCRDLNDVEAFPENVVAMHMKRTEWAGVNRGVVTMSTWVDELARYCEAAGVSDAVRHRATGYMLDIAHGRASKVGKNQATQYRRLMRDAGVHPQDVRQPASVEVRYDLDFEAGRVVRRVA
jgi:hypothetical protein